MAGTITFSGLSSGLDTGSWVNALVSVKSTSITSLESQKAQKENLLSIVDGIKSYFTSFQTCLQKLTDSSLGVASMDLFLQNLATSSNTNIATASATTEAARQSYDVLVDSLATSTKASSGYAKLEEKYATLDTKLGLLGAKNGTITVNDKSFNITTNDTIGSLLKKFENIGVEAKFDESKSLFTVGCSVNEIDEGSTNIKSALKLSDKTVTGITSGSLVYANRDTEFSKLGLTGGKVMIAGEEHTITQNGDTYTINKDGEPAVDMNTIGDFLDYLTSSAVNAEEATIDSNGNIIIKGALLESVESGSNIIDILKLTENDNRILMESNPLSYLEIKVADLDTSLAQLGIAANTTLVVEGSNNDITTDMKLRDIKTILNTAGIDFDIDSNGVITIDTHGKEISGTLLDVLGLNPSASGTTITSSPIQAQVAADGSTLLSTLGVGASNKYNVYSVDGTLISSNVSGASSQTISEFVNTLKTTYGLDASFDEGSHKIIINDGYITGAVADALGVTRQTVSTSAIATTSSTLADIGITASKTLSINGGTAVEYGTGTQLSAIIGAISSAGGSAYLDSQGYLNVSGVQLSGTLVDALGLSVTGETTTITGGTLKYVSSVSSTGGILDTSGTVYDVDLNSKIGDITGSTNSYTLSVNGGEAVTYNSETQLSALQTQIEDAGGTFSLVDNVVTIEGVELSGTLLDALGFSLDIDTSYESSQINITNTHVATRETELSTLGIGSDKQLSINGGEGKSYTTIGAIMDDIIAAGGSAELNNGNLTISGVTLSGSLMEALGIAQTGETTSIESDYLSYVSDSVSIGNALDPSGDHNIDWDTEIGSITGTEDSYTLSVNGGTSTTYDSIKTLADIKDQIESAGGTMVMDSVNNTIRIEGVESLSGTLLEALGLTPDISTTYTCSSITLTSVNYATDSTTLAELGISSDKKLSINGGEEQSYNTIGDIRGAITAAGGSSTLEDGNLTVSGVTLSGSLMEALGIVETQAGSTTITSNQLSITSSTTTTSSETLYGSEVSGIDWTSTLGSILGEDTSALGFYIDGSEKNYTTATQLSDIKSDIIAAGGTMELDTENNKITISGVEVSGTLATALGLTNPTYTTSISSNNPIYIVGSIENADSNTKLVDVGVTEGTYSIDIFDEAGTSKYSNSNFSVQSGTTVGDFLNAVNSNLGADSATITAGVITITNGYVTGTLPEALGIGTVQSVIGTTMTSSGIQYTEYITSDWIGDVTIENGTTVAESNGPIGEVTIKSGTANIAVSNGPIATVEEKIDWSSYFIGTVTKNNTATTGRVSDISNFSSGGCYLIEDASDLTALATLVNSGKSTTGVTFILGNDIDMSSVANFTPIGTSSSNAFKGTLCGNGHVIKNLTIDTSSDYTGLFGYISGGTIRDLGIVDANVTSTGQYTGILAGYASGSSQITNCFATGTIDGEGVTGGLIGYIKNSTVDKCNTDVYITGSGDIVGGFVGSCYYATISNCFAIGDVDCNGAIWSGGFAGIADGTISNCFASGYVRGLNEVGGFAGEASGTISNCFATGDVTATGSYVGGFIGWIQEDEIITINNCYSEGYVHGSSEVGGFIGYNHGTGTIEQSYSSGQVTGTGGNICGFIGSDNGSVTVTNCVYNSGTGLTSGVSSGVTGLSLAQMKTQSVMEAQGFTAENGWTYTAGMTPNRLNQVAARGAVYVSELTDFTSGDTYHISTVADLQKLAELVNSGADTQNVTFILDNDIDMSSVANFTPIGNNSNVFYGAFYGNGHVIKNLTIDSSSDSTGLFGEIEGAVIQDLGIVDANITSTGNYTGILVGNTCGGYITNCYVTGTVSGSDSVGGLVGCGNYGLTITDSYATCNVTGTNYVGGLVGDFTGGSHMTNCYATGNVSGDMFVGGLVGTLGGGSDCSINKCYATGDVSGSDDVGGLLGEIFNSTITNSYSSGNVTGTGSEVYGFVVLNGPNVTVTNCVYNSDTGLTSGVSSGVTGLTLAQMKTQSVMEAQGFTAENGWSYTSGLTPHFGNQNAIIDAVYVSSVNDFTSGDTYHISTAADLQKLSELVNSGKSTTGVRFILDNDIDLSSVANFTSIGNLSNTFDGAFYGNGHVIKNLTIDSSSDYTGLFGYICGAIIQDLGVVNANVTSTGNCTGILVGCSEGDAITNCYATGTVSGTQEVGGLVGYSSSGLTITDSYATCNVTGTIFVGGLVGDFEDDSHMTNCYATGNVSGDMNVGGLVGLLGGGDVCSINKCYATGTVTGTDSDIYGFVGCDGGDNTITNCVYNSDTGLTSGVSSGVTGLTLAQMQTQSVMEAQGFTAENGWSYTSGLTPQLCTPVVQKDRIYVSELSRFISGDTYYISTAADLQKLSELVNAGSDTTGVTFILDNDIDLSSVANFTPIGNSYEFNGAFYGNGHVIKNLTIDSSSGSTGLFGNTQGATIRDLGIVDANVTSTGYYTGILVGYASGGDITNCYVTGTVSGDYGVGGLVGGGYCLTITDSYATCNVTGTESVGGLVGEFEGDSHMTNCYATGTVSGGNSVGGLVGAAGYHEPSCSINKCYATGNVSGSDYVGGLVGSSSDGTITNSYSTGTVTGTGSNVYGFVGDDWGGNTITNCVYNSDTGLTSGVSSGVTGLTLEQMKTQSVMEAQGFTAENGWSYTSGLTPHFGNQNAIRDAGYVSSVNGFTSGNTYHISTVADLQKLAELVNSGNDTTGVTFILDNDIDLSSVANFTPIGIDGTYSQRFNGCFYGNGHVIKNLTIENPTSNYVGLFGYTYDATIRDLGVVDANVTGNIAGIISAYGGGTFTNCYATGTATSINGPVGGLFGVVTGGLRLEQCYTDVSVTGNNGNVGGLVGVNDCGTINLYQCYSMGDVTATASYAGGLVGMLNSGDTISNCYVTGTVSGTYCVGGLVGRANIHGGVTASITNSYSSGSVTGTGSNVYGISGYGGSITNCVYNSDTAPGSAGTGLTLAQMQTQSVMEAQGFTEENGWVYSIGNTPGLRAITGSTTQTLTSSNPANVTLEQLSETANRNLSITVDGTTYSNTFTNTSSVQDVLDWINDNVTGVTASLDSSGNLTLQGDGDISASGGVWESLYTDATTQNTSNTMSTANTASGTLTYSTSDTIIDGNTTVGDLMDTESGTFNITIGDFSGNYGCSTTLSTVLNDINNSGNGYTASIVDGVFSVSGDGQFNISGALGLKLYGENGTTTQNPTYISDTLSSTASTVADGNTTLAELGVNSGNFRITDKDGNLVTTIDITDSMKISDLNSAISSYGTVSITGGKVTATLNGAYRLEDGTSNLITKLKFNTYTDNTSTLTTTSTLAQMGFAAGGTIEVSIDGVAQTPINFDGSEDMSDIISRLNALGITASVSGGKFTATSDHEFTLGGNIGSLLITGGTYDTTEAGYATSSPLSYNVSSNVSGATKIGDLTGNGTSGTVTVSINDGEAQSQTFTADKDMNDVITWLSETYGITASFDGNGNFTVTGDVKFRLGGTIIDALQTNGTSYNHVDTLEGYDSGDLSYTTTEPASLATKLKEFDITSGTINIVDKDSNIIGTVTLDANSDFSAVNSQLEEYGIVLSFDSNHKIVANSSNNYRISDATSNFVEKTGLNTWNENVVEVSGSTKLNQIGFGSGGTIDVTIGDVTESYQINDGETDLSSICSGLEAFVLEKFGVPEFNASITNGIFTATSDHSFTLGGNLGNYLTSNGANGYQTISVGYATSSPLTYTTTSKMSDSTTIGDFMGDGGNGTLTVSINDGEAQSQTFTAEQNMSDVITWLGTHGITASINETTGQMTATSTDKFRLGGTIADILGGSYNDDYTYVSDDLSWSPAGDVTMDGTTLKDLGISSGNINVVDGGGNTVTTITVDENDTLGEVAAKLPSYMTMTLGADKKITVTATGNYRLADDTSDMVSKLGLTTWNETETNISGSTKLNQIGFGSGGTIDVTINGTTKSLTLNDGTTDLNSVISQLKTFVQNEFGVSDFNASITNGKFTATSDHEFTLGGNLGNYLVSGTTNGYVTTADGYKTESPLMTGADNYRAESEELVYNTAMTTQSTLEQLGLSSGGTLNVNKGGSYTPYNLGKDTKIQDIIDILATNHNIIASVDSNGKFTATSTDETFTLSGTVADILTQGGTYTNTTTGYTSNPLSYSSNGAVNTSTKLTDFGVATGDVYVIENDVTTAKYISITNDTTIGQFFNALNMYGMHGSIETNAAGESFIRITSDTNTKIVDGTSDLVTKLGFNEIRQGDFTGNIIYWDDDATSGLVTEDMLITSFDRGGFSAVGTLSFQTGTGDDAVSHTITITDEDTVGTLLQKFKNEGVNAELDDGIIKISAGLDTITLTGGTSGLVNTIGLDVKDVDIYAQNSDELQHEGLSSYSAANYADGDTLLSTVNVTDGVMSIYVDGIRCTVEVDSTQTFSNLFSAISDEIALKTGLTAKVGFLGKNGDVVQNPTAENNTGVISILVEGDHKVVVGASNDKTNFATIANLVNSNENNVTGSRALFKVNANSKITDSGLFRAGDVSEGSFKIGDATFTIDSETTISDLVQQINRSETSYATAYWDSLSGTLVLQSTETGESLINIEAIDSNFTNIMGFTQTKNGVDSLVTENQKLGSNAQVRINGTAITCDKNVIKSEVSKIKGLTINLKNVSAGETVTITVEQDKDSIYNAVSDTIDAYNTMMEALNKELADRDSLGGESILKLMRNNLKRLMTGTVNGTYVYRNMSAVGISTGEARNDVSTDVTSLIIDKDKFMDALTNDSDAVKTLLIGSQANPGVFLQANNIVTKALSTSGYFSNMENTLSKNITNLDKKISKTTMFVENYRARLEKQFKLMESTISGLQNAYANLLNG